MKFSFSALSLVFGAAAVQGNDFTMRGSSKSAANLLANARKLEDGQQAQQQDMAFLMNYSIKMLSCVSDEMVRTEQNGNEYESSAVVLRLCPANTCDSQSATGCSEGHGDYVVGIKTFMEFYKQYEEELQEEMQKQYEQQYQYQNQNGQQNGGQRNLQQEYSKYTVYNQYGMQFDAEEYFECAAFRVEEAQNGQQQNGNYQNGNYQQGNYYNQQQGYYYGEQETFVGPSCSADGTTIVLSTFMDDQCMYPSTTDFNTLTNGQWPQGMPFSTGGLVSLDCVSCYKTNENYEMEANEICETVYEESVNRCEQDDFGWNSYYNNQMYQNYQYNNNMNGQQQQQGQQGADGYYYGGYGSASGCDYVESVIAKSKSTMFDAFTVDTSNDSVFIAGIVMITLAAVGIVYVIYSKFFAKSTTVSKEPLVKNLDDDYQAPDDKAVE